MRTRRVLGWGALAIALLSAVAVASVWWSVRSERGSAWLLTLLPGVQVDAPSGRLLGDFSAKQVIVKLPGGSNTFTLTGLAWKGLTVERASSPRWLRIDIAELEIARIELAFGATKGKPLKAPSDLSLPIELELRALHVGELHAAALGAQPIRELRAHLHAGANGGAEHRIDGLALSWDRLQASGDARIASAAPMSLTATLQLAQQAADTLPPLRARATLAGPLAEPLLQATLRAAEAPGRPAQALDVRATLRPFAPWPLGALQASTTALDLSAFSTAAPATAITGRAVAISTAGDQPATLTLALSNALPGRWNEGKLPLHRLAVELVGRPDQPNALTVQQLDAELGTPQQPAGRLTGQGRWSPAEWSLDAQLADVRPSLLDARAPSMRLSGPVVLTGAGAVKVKAELAGQVDGIKAARAVQLKLDATLSVNSETARIELRDLQALAGEARAQLSGLVTHAASDAPWAVKLDAALKDFDPALWWPGRDDSPWRNQLNRLNAGGKVDIQLPAAAISRAPLAMLAALRGQAALTLSPSTLAGVPLTGSATLQSGGGAQVTTAIDLIAEGNRVQATGQLATGGDGASDAWDVTVDGPVLARLAPLYRLLQPKAGDAAFAGTLTASAHLSGRWPALTTQGQLEANALRVGAFSVQKAQGRWSLGTSMSAPVDAQLTLTQAARFQAGGAAGPSIEDAQLTLKGTGRAHTLELRADSKARPPAWVDGVQATPASSTAHTLALLQVQGGLVDVPGTALAGWRGTIQQLDVRSSATAANAAPLLHTQDLALEALWSGGPLRMSVQPGRAEVFGGAVRWSRFTWAAAATDSGFAQIEADAEVEPLRIAPLLARAQPDFGWGGDLSVSAHIKLRSAPSFSADIVIERASGDLTVTEEQGTRTLGLTDLRLGLAADNGVWNFTQGMAGTTLGVAAGAVVVRTTPQATWPPADAPIQGVLELQVADLGTWGTWVPPGWRLAGALRASAGINGRFGAPEYTGEVVGTQLGVRNFLQGVNVSEGDIAIRLQGTSARIERFTAKAGNGSVKLDGEASLGEAPKAVLQVTADKFQLLGRVDRRIVTSGNGRLQLDAKSLAFDGQFGVDEGLIDFTRSDAPKLSSDVNVVRARGVPAPADAASAASAAAEAANPAREVALDLRVALGDKLRLRGRGIDTGLSGDLRITSPGGRLAVNGTVRATDGTYAAYGQKLTIDKGLITFNGAVENPRLDIEATRPNLDVRVGVAVSGLATNPRIRLFSEPELSELDKLSWLVMGRASDGLGRTDTALVQRAALALLAGEGGGVTDQLTKAIGLDDIGVRQTDGEVRETVISLGKQLSRRWYVGYERGLNATTGNFQLIYRIAQRFTLRAQSGQDSSLDLIWTWRWK
ncbi:MAG: translocation/assembly module TamB domain-containing protein [Burkholderiales bacterium]